MSEYLECDDCLLNMPWGATVCGHCGAKYGYRDKQVVEKDTSGGPIGGALLMAVCSPAATIMHNVFWLALFGGSEWTFSNTALVWGVFGLVLGAVTSGDKTVTKTFRYRVR